MVAVFRVRAERSAPVGETRSFREHPRLELVAVLFEDLCLATVVVFGF
jgi:hypothetical protein